MLEELRFVEGRAALLDRKQSAREAIKQRCKVDAPDVYREYKEVVDIIIRASLKRDR